MNAIAGSQAEGLPSGTVTFAFTDIEGSTERWERDSVAMQAALRRHDDILRESLTGAGGTIFKTIGDAFCAAFARPDDAAAALITVQQRLAAEDFSAVGGLRVRAAVHTGSAHERDGDYFGPPVNRVARLLAIAHGGQVLLSGATSALVKPRLPASVTLRDLGRHRLKDLIEPEDVFQLIAPELETDFPALRSLEALRHNLPQQMTSLIGRDAEVAEITSLLALHRLITVVGAGGVGKTRITLQAGANLLDGWADGVWFIELAPLTGGEYLPAAVSQAMELRLGADGASIDGLVRALKTKRTLLIFDNCEHIVHAVSVLAGALLRGCPYLRILASSRQALGIAGEATYRMPSLAVPPASLTSLTATEAATWSAIALFTERAAAADRRFMLTDANAVIVADICRKLDGIPLAIELAAARVAIMSPKQVNDRLSERFRILRAARRDAIPRQQTLHATIDWSYDLLDQQEREVFRRLGVFAGPLQLEGAVAVAAPDGLDEIDVLDLLQSLVDKSLVGVEQDGEALRYRLPESMRAYAREKLQAQGEEASTAERHSAYLRALVARAYEEFDTKMPPGWLERYSADIDDVRAALEFSLGRADRRADGAQLTADAGPIFLRMELLGEGLRWCAAARSVADVPPGTAGRLEYVASMMHNNLGERRNGLACAELAVTLLRQSPDERGLVRALSQVAQMYARSGRFEDARAPAAQALERARALREPRVLISVLRRCAFSLPDAEMEQARLYFAEASRLARAVQEYEEASLVLDWWASREASMGDIPRAIELSTEALSYAPGEGRIYLEMHVAGWALAMERFDEAAPHAQRALALSKNVQNPVLEACAIVYCAPQLAKRDPAAAARLFGYAAARLRELGWEADRDDELTFGNVSQVIRGRLGAGEFDMLVTQGEVLSEGQALTLLSL